MTDPKGTSARDFLAAEAKGRADVVAQAESDKALFVATVARYRRELLLDAKISQRQLAEILDCSQPMLSQLLSGKARSAHLEHLFAKHFGLEREDCFVPWERGR